MVVAGGGGGGGGGLPFVFLCLVFSRAAQPAHSELLGWAGLERVALKRLICILIAINHY